jgi:hypothetical protein
VRLSRTLELDQAAVAVEAAYGAGLVVAAGVAVLATVRVDRPPVALADALAARWQNTIEALRDAVAQAVGDPSLAVVVLDGGAAPAAPVGHEVTLVAPGGADVLVGAIGDPDLGPVLAVGFGGRRAGLGRTAAFRLLPVTDAETDELIDSA